MLEHAPMTVQSGYRLYTSQRQRREIGIETTYGYLTPVSVGIVTRERETEWDGSTGRYATFRQTLGTDGEIRIPLDVRRALDISQGDSLRVSLKSLD